MHTRHAALAAAMFIVAAVLVPAATTAAEIDGIDLQLPTGRSVSGTVTDAGGAPVAGAVVGVCPSAFDCFQTDAISGTNGDYTIRGIVPGNYVVSARPPDGANLLQVYHGGDAGSVSDPDLAVSIDLTAADAVAINLEMPAGLRISGTVRDPEGDPVPGVHVSPSGSSSGGSTIPSDATGHFQAVGLAPGTYSLQVSPPEGSPFLSGYVADGTVQPGFGGTQVVLDSGDADGLDFNLIRGRTISGHLGGATGQAIAVTALGDFSGATNPVDASGDFVAGPLWPGSYHLVFTTQEAGDDSQFPYGLYNGDGQALTSQNDPGVSVDVSDSNVAGLSALVPDLPTISGHVSDDAGPVANATVQACGDLGCAQVGTAADGGYVFLNLPDSTFLVLAGAARHVASYYSESGPTTDPDEATPVTIAGADVSGIDIVLGTGSSIRGRITGPSGEPVQGAFAFAFIIGGGVSPLGPGGDETDANGEYELAGLVDGNYRLQVNPPVYSPYLFGYWSTSGWTADFSAASPIVVASEPTIVGRSPEPDATGVSRRATVTATFSTDVIGVGRSTFEVRDARTNRLLPGSVAYDSSSRTATFRPTAPLGRIHAYVVLVKAGITDLAGNPLAPETWRFTTGT